MEGEGTLDYLTESEKERRYSYVCERARKRFTLRRSALRLLLSQRLGLDPLEIKIVEYEKGKPFLPAVPDLHFSLSQSGSLAVIAMGNCRLGADIERVDCDYPIAEVSDHVMTAQERINGMNTPDLFFRIWTAKEAILKAAGTGLLTPMTDLEVTLGDDGFAIQRLPLGFPKKEDWKTALFPLADDHLVALAWIEPAN